MSTKDIKDTVTEKSKAAAEVAKNAASDAYDTASEKASETYESAKKATSQIASDASSYARNEVSARAEAGKNTLADEGSRLAAGLRDVAHDPETSDLHARFLDTVASSISSVSDDLRGRSVGSMIEEVETFARRNPGAFFAGAAVAGFALARFAKASKPADPVTNLPATAQDNAPMQTRFHNNGAAA